MLKQQTVTSRHKKASDVRASKASHLTVIPCTGNRPMNNSTATDFNSQIDQAYNTASEALEAINQAMEHFGGLHSLFNSIWLQTKDNPLYKDSDVFHAAKMGCYVCGDFNLTLKSNKEDLEKHLKVLGGASHE